MIENDITDPGTHGSCEIRHGEFISWVMEDGTSTQLNYVAAFDLGSEASGIDQNDDVIARYEAHTDRGNYYLMLDCDLWNSDHIQQRVLSTLGNIVTAPFIAVFDAVKFVVSNVSSILVATFTAVFGAVNFVY